MMIDTCALSSSSVLAQLIMEAAPEERRALRDDIQECPLPFLRVDFVGSDVVFNFGDDLDRRRRVRHLPVNARAMWDMEDLRAWIRKTANSILSNLKS